MMDEFEDDLSYVWLTPGAGELEEQSYNEMVKLLPNLDSYLLSDALTQGFTTGAVYFFNWEMVTGKKNNAIKENVEWANLYQRITEFHRRNGRFILIIDEEDKNDTEKAKDLIDKFKAKKIIRASATANKTSDCEFFEVDEKDAIESGLLTKKLYINYDIPDDDEIKTEVDFLIEKADEKRKQCVKEYNDLDLNINPLVVIQFPNNEQDYIDAVRAKLATMDYKIDNGTIANWMSDAHDNIKDIKENGSLVSYVFTKQAISTGWNCPRAKILIKLRENSSESFTIQTVGRIRRTAEGKHYNNDVLDNSYIYTTDKKYTEQLKKGLPIAVERMNLKFKDDIKNIKLVKEISNKDFIGSAEICKKIKDFYKKKYGLTVSCKNNKEKLINSGYNFSNEVEWDTVKGALEETGDTIDKDIAIGTLKLKMVANTTANGFQMTETVRKLKPVTKLSEQEIRAILQNLFNKNGQEKYRLLDLENNDLLYAFVINNIELIKKEIEELRSENPYLLGTNFLNLAFNTVDWNILETDNLAFTTEYEGEKMKKNVYEGYDTRFISTNAGIRSLTEHKFEKYIEKCSDVKWIYKNGDGGKEYFSIVYIDGFINQREFYPDYIIGMNDGSIMIVEAKGGEVGGKDQNIDKVAKIKFEALKQYAKKYNLKWGFVRAYEDKLKFNNTKWSDSMGYDTNWIPIENAIK